MYKLAKRCLDCILAGCAILVLWPLFLLIAVGVKVSSDGPVIYKGLRTGLNDTDFYIFKFRTMVVNAESLGGPSTAENDPRFTRLGKMLRAKKLDELPQFFNVIFGDMALVGPRPQVRFYTDKYSVNERKILTMRPGITDLASLYFSDMDKTLGDGDVDLVYMKKIEPLKNKLRLRYVEEASMMLDVRIIIETAFTIIGIKNITKLNLIP